MTLETAHIPWLFPLVLVSISLIIQGPVPVLQKQLQLESVRDSASASAIVGALITLFGLALIPFRGYHMPEINWQLAWKIGLMGCLYAIANILIFQAIRNISPALYGVIFTTRVLYVAGIAVFFFNEAFGIPQFVGLGVVLAGILYAIRTRSGKPKELSKEKDDARAARKQRWIGIRDATLGTAAFGIANTLDAAIIKDFDALSYLPVRFLLPTLLTMVFLRLGVRELWAYARGRRTRLLALSICQGVASATFMEAYQHGRELAVLATVHQLSLFVTIAYAAVVDKSERRNAGKYTIAGVVCVAGVALVRLA